MNLLNDPLLFPSLKNNDEPEKEMKRMHQLLNNSTVEKVGRHGKYFWIRFSGNLIMLMHFGMTGMIKMQNIKSHLIFMENGGDKKVLKSQKKRNQLVDSKDTKDIKIEEEEQEKIKLDDTFTESWPPKFSKLEMTFEKPIDNSNIELSFVDPRRLGRIRLLENIENDQDLFKMEPLSRQGPDYSKTGVSLKLFEFGDADPTIYVEPLRLDEFCALISLRKKAIKSLLLDQDCFAGVGNWVSDEILYQSRIHPNEILSNCVTKESPVLETLYHNIKYVCAKSVELEGDVKRFPEDWMMLHRWGKRRTKQERPKVGGHPIDFLTIGGRTSCYVPKLQVKMAGK